MNINEQSRGSVDVCDDTIIANQKDKIMSEDRKFLWTYDGGSHIICAARCCDVRCSVARCCAARARLCRNAFPMEAFISALVNR